MIELLPGLFLGSVADAEKFSDQFGAVVNCTPEFKFFNNDNFQLRVPVQDNGYETKLLFNYLEEACESIETHLKSKTPVLVHCVMGFQRSPAVCVAYLMWAGKSLNDAIHYVHMAKPDTFNGSSSSGELDVHFLPSLVMFEKKIKTKI